MEGDKMKWQRVLYQPNLPLGKDGRRVTACEEHIRLSKEAAKEGMVLLKNEEQTLPFVKGTRLALFGKATFDYVKGGGGSGILEDVLELPELGLVITCAPADCLEEGPDTFTLCPEGPIRVRFRETGDRICLPGGTKSLKKLFIDRKIPAHDRDRIPVLADDKGLLAVCGIGPDQGRKARELPAVTVRIRSLTDL